MSEIEKSVTINYDSARAYVFELMDRQLPPGLAYHGLHHTRDQVLPAVEIFCCDMNISREQQLLIATAALFHDIGFTKQYMDNEEISAGMAVSILPDFGYQETEINSISKLILATRMPQKPQTLAEKILCDADLVSLGRPEFFETSMMLRRETGTFLIPVPLRTWLEEQYIFLCTHRYFTTAARRRLNEEKEKNRAELQAVLNSPYDIRTIP